MRKSSEPDAPPHFEASSETIDYLQHYCVVSLWKLSYFQFADALTLLMQPNRAHCRNLFRELDTDHDQLLSPEELFVGLQSSAQSLFTRSMIKYFFQLLELVSPQKVLLLPSAHQLCSAVVAGGSEEHVAHCCRVAG